LNGAEGAPAEWQKYAKVLRSARERLGNLRIDDPALPFCIAGLARIEATLHRPVRIAILGETNSGKTSVAGLLLGTGVLPVSVLSNTSVPVLVSHGSQPTLAGINRDGIAVHLDGPDDDRLKEGPFRAIALSLPLQWLQDYQIADTPPTPLPAEFTADADIVVWCTVATRAWTESERSLWLSVPARCRKAAILVATHKDSFYSDEDCAQVMRRLGTMTKGLFNDVLIVSAADAGDEAESASIASSKDGDELRAAIARCADLLRARRLLKSRRIVGRLARISLQAFGRRFIRPEAAATLSHWSLSSGEIVKEYASGRTTVEQALEQLLMMFAETAEDLRPGAIENSARRTSQTPTGLTHPKSSAMPFRSVAMVRADLTVVLRMLATTPPSESPDYREQRSAARATLVTLAELDGTFAELGTWLTAQTKPESAVTRAPQ
jgi:hypothetical protein